MAPTRIERCSGRPLKLAAGAAGVFLIGGSMLFGNGGDGDSPEQAKAEQPDVPVGGIVGP
ncbi:hypothetical protein AB0L10_43280 [Streptomyces flaveolus]|uniref:hypothetical protein n=1 Tax=Streptomyces flaveolus TaxID=67297 RepID=UPI0034233F17